MPSPPLAPTPRQAYRIRRFLLRREHPDNHPWLDEYLVSLDFPIVTVDPGPLTASDGALSRDRLALPRSFGYTLQDARRETFCASR